MKKYRLVQIGGIPVNKNLIFINVINHSVFNPLEERTMIRKNYTYQNINDNRMIESSEEIVLEDTLRNNLMLNAMLPIIPEPEIGIVKQGTNPEIVDKIIKHWAECGKNAQNFFVNFPNPELLEKLNVNYVIDTLIKYDPPFRTETI